MKKKKTTMDLAGIGSRVKAIRKKLDCTQKEFAKIMGITMVTLSDIETGKKRPGSDLLFILSDLYNVSLNFLLHGKGKMFRLDEEIDGVFIEDNAFGDYTDDVRELLWYMQNSRLARGAFVALTKEYLFRNESLIKLETDLHKEKNKKEFENG
jgi:transcriptional regulator with XRE-family HTH domain